MSVRLVWITAAFLFAFILFSTHYLLLDAHWYWTYRWLDIPMHIFGGVTLATLFVGILPANSRMQLLLLLVFAFVGWEIFEYFFDLTVTRSGTEYWIDTVADFCNDAFGALIVYLIARKTLWQ